MRMLATVVFSALSLALFSASALAFSGEPIPDGPGVQNQFSDPDEAVEHMVNGAGGRAGTEISAGTQIPSGAGPVQPRAATQQDAEPVNPGWPAWMVWHQQ